MDDISQTLPTADLSLFYNINCEEGDDDDEDFCDVETWETLNKSFKEVESVLDHNRRLIQQVNDNHRSKIPRNMAKNVELITQINSNMSKVVGLYSNISKNFSHTVKQRRGLAKKGVEKVESGN